MGVGEEVSPLLSALLKAALCSGSNFLVIWQGWACWERHLACALFLLASRTWKLVPLKFYKSQICKPPRRRGAWGSCWIFFNETWIRFVIFYFPFFSPTPPPLFTLLICSVSLIRNLETSQSRCRRGKTYRFSGEGGDVGRNGLHSPPPPPSPLPRGHGDPSVVSAPAHAQRVGHKTLCEVCFDTRPPPPPSTHTILRTTFFP